MADSGAVNRVGFGVTGAYPLVPASGSMSAPRENVGQYPGTSLYLDNSGGGGASLDYSRSHYTGPLIIFTRYYKMRGMDKNVNGLYDVWIVTGVPDFTGNTYAGALTTPLRDIVVQDTWTFPVIT